jgi:hypothetical protein
MKLRSGPVAVCVLASLCAGVWLWRSERDEPVRAGAVRAAAPSPSFAAPAARPGEITAATLLDELVDVGRLARLPSPAYRARFASSYDRRSVNPGDAAGWFANDDWASAERANYLRVEARSGRNEYVLLDAKGPGAIVRLWSASPAGTLRIYFDDEERPTVEEPFEEFIGGTGSMPAPFAYVAARGYNSYFPLPFRRACKITIDSLVAREPSSGRELPKVYYQIQYREYPESSAKDVRTYRAVDAESVKSNARVSRIFNEPFRTYEATPAAVRRSFEANARGLALTLERDGGAVVRELSVVVRDTSDAALRRARLRASFDGETSVDVPLGDFFGAAPGLSPYDTLPFSVREDGSLSCRFPMPFRERALFAIEGSPGASAELVFEPDAWSDASLHFHARHRAPATVKSQPPSDLRFLSVRGEGVYVGDAFNIDNPAARWWGEGDEKIYLEGEAFPSCFGTGTEDYYGYAWSRTELFARALHAQPRAAPENFSGRASNNRFRTLDAIPFARALRFDLELWHWEETRVTWDGMSYFYARPGATFD